MSQIVNLILDRMVEHLTMYMRVGVDEGDLGYADIVKKGLLQENKTKKNVALGCQGGDHDDPTYIDSISTMEKLPNIGFYFDAREVGGGQMWWRRGVVRMEFFFIRERLIENDAFNAAYEILGRLQANIENMNVSDLIDDYGERAIKMYCYGNTFFESGGGRASYIFRGKTFWQCLTERP